MSLKRNVLANYASQIYVSLVNIVMVPMYVQHMGAEAYGLVGFFGVLQALFQLVDIGLSPTMARETARHNGGAIDGVTLRRLLRALEGVFVAIAVVAAGGVLLSADAISTKWIKAEHLPSAEVRLSVMLMGVAVALRWMSGLYRGAVNGFEQIAWLSGFNIAVATARFVLVVPVLIWVGSTPEVFFTYQLGVATLELGVLALYTYRLMPQSEGGATPWELAPLRDVLKFSLGIAFTSSVWVLVTQTDKLLLSKLLPLTQYAYFSLAVLIASGVTLIGGPISNVMLPRLTKLSAAGDAAAVIALYRVATQAVAVISGAASAVLAVFSKQVLWIWTGDMTIAANAADVLSLYAIGNGILAVSAFPYFLQFAKGDLRLHMIGNLLFPLVLFPALILGTIRFGAIGAGAVWVGSNAAYLLLWVPKVHNRFAPGLHAKWIGEDVIAVAGAAVAAVAAAKVLLTWPSERVPAGLLLLAICVITVVAAACGSAIFRREAATMLFRGRQPEGQEK